MLKLIAAFVKITVANAKTVTKPQPAATRRRAQTLAAGGLQVAETNVCVFK